MPGRVSESPTLTESRTYDEDDYETEGLTRSTNGGNFGHLQVSTLPPLDDDLDLDTLGMAFGTVDRVEEIPSTSERTVEIEDTRTNEDIRRDALEMVANALDLPDDVIQQAKLSLRQRTAELRDYLMKDVVPLVLSIGPALQSVQQMVPRMFDDGEVEPEIPMDALTAYGFSLGMIAARLKLMELLQLPTDVRERLTARLIPEEKRNVK